MFSDATASDLGQDFSSSLFNRIPCRVLLTLGPPRRTVCWHSVFLMRQMSYHHRWEQNPQPNSTAHEQSIGLHRQSDQWDTTPRPSFDATIRAPVYTTIRSTPRRILAPTRDSSLSRLSGAQDLVDEFTIRPKPAAADFSTTCRNESAMLRTSAVAGRTLFGRSTADEDSDPYRIGGRKRRRPDDITREEIEERQMGGHQDESKIASAGRWIMSAISRLPLVGSLISPATSSAEGTPPEPGRSPSEFRRSLLAPSVPVPQPAPPTTTKALHLSKNVVPVPSIVSTNREGPSSPRIGSLEQSDDRHTSSEDQELEYVLKLRRERKLRYLTVIFGKLALSHLGNKYCPIW